MNDYLKTLGVIFKAAGKGVSEALFSVMRILQPPKPKAKKQPKGERTKTVKKNRRGAAILRDSLGRFIKKATGR